MDNSLPFKIQSGDLRVWVWTDRLSVKMQSRICACACCGSQLFTAPLDTVHRPLAGFFLLGERVFLLVLLLSRSFLSWKVIKFHISHACMRQMAARQLILQKKTQT